MKSKRQRIDKNKTRARLILKKFGKLLIALLFIGLFAFIIGPRVQKSVPIMNELARVIEDRDIDAGAYFYTEIEASYDAEAYLRESLDNPKQSFKNRFLGVAGILICFFLLWAGFSFLPD